MYDTTYMTQLVWLCKIANSYKLDVQLLENRMSSISSNLYEGNKPITFQVSQCWIISKKNLVEPKSGKNIKVFVESKKIKAVIRKNGEGERAKRSKCWTAHSWGGRIILITITLVNCITIQL